MIGILKELGRRSSVSVNGIRKCSSFNQPLSANDMPRPGGIATFMRLPHQTTAEGLDVGVLGIPMDCGTSNRPGTRFGPRQIRTESSLLRPANSSTGDRPFSRLQVADLGDIPLTMYDLKQAVADIRRFIGTVLARNCTPISMGGDHTLTYPILQAVKKIDPHNMKSENWSVTLYSFTSLRKLAIHKTLRNLSAQTLSNHSGRTEKFGPVGLVHVDAHGDVNDTMMGCRIAHGTPFRRAHEEGLLDPKRVVQIGLRGTNYAPEDNQWSLDQGFRLVPAEECWHKSLVPLMAQVRDQMGEGPVYVSLDIDALDPSFAPGTGTPEIGGLTTIQMLEIIRGLKGINIIGGDLVEVSPPYDPSGNTALTAANLIFELLCVLQKK